MRRQELAHCHVGVIDVHLGCLGFLMRSHVLQPSGTSSCSNPDLRVPAHGCSGCTSLRQAWPLAGMNEHGR